CLGSGLALSFGDEQVWAYNAVSGQFSVILESLRTYHLFDSYPSCMINEDTVLVCANHDHHDDNHRAETFLISVDKDRLWEAT
ncbi:hypothetical protein KIPB_009299, partial [Kipferlia bialata]